MNNAKIRPSARAHTLLLEVAIPSFLGSVTFTYIYPSLLSCRHLQLDLAYHRLQIFNPLKQLTSAGNHASSTVSPHRPRC